MGQQQIREGSIVSWNWGNGQAKGEVIEIFTSDVEETIKGNRVSREASKDKPAYLIEQEDGDKVLKSRTELNEG